MAGTACVARVCVRESVFRFLTRQVSLEEAGQAVPHAFPKPSRKRRKIRPPRVSYEFTDLDLTAFGGSSMLARTAQRFGLFELLAGAVSVKVRDRGASDVGTLSSLICSLARGHGTKEAIR